MTGEVPLVWADGGDIGARRDLVCDVVVVGSGPAGAVVARELACAGVDVVVIEEGRHHKTADFPADSFTAMATMMRDMGASLTRSRAPMPVVQGRALGGGSVVNGAISWRLPRDVYDAWLRTDPGLAEGLAWDAIEAATDAVERDLGVTPTAADIAGANNELLARGAETLGLEHRPIARYTQGCVGLGRCLQGCPRGHKQSVDRVHLHQAADAGARIVTSARVTAVERERGRAVGVRALAAAGGMVHIRARHAVVLAASAVQTPALLLRSGITHGPVGRRFQCHPGASMAGLFADPVRVWTGATQGHEVIGMRGQGLKFEALGYGMAIAATRVKGVGRRLADGLDTLSRQAQWGVAVKAEAQGRVLASRDRATVRYTLGQADMRKVRTGVRVLGELMLAAGAEAVMPGVYGWHQEVRDPATMARFEAEGPLDARAYAMATTHLFASCAMASDPADGVVGPGFRHHTVQGLYIADSSVFPSSTGVNPQTSIMALATLCARRVAAHT